jgi:hypothetical protein
LLGCGCAEEHNYSLAAARAAKEQGGGPAAVALAIAKAKEEHEARAKVREMQQSESGDRVGDAATDAAGQQQQPGRRKSLLTPFHEEEEGQHIAVKAVSSLVPVSGIVCSDCVWVCSGMCVCASADVPLLCFRLALWWRIYLRLMPGVVVSPSVPLALIRLVLCRRRSSLVPWCAGGTVGG